MVEFGADKKRVIKDIIIKWGYFEDRRKIFF